MQWTPRETFLGVYLSSDMSCFQSWSAFTKFLLYNKPGKSTAKHIYFYFFIIPWTNKQITFIQIYSNKHKHLFITSVWEIPVCLLTPRYDSAVSGKFQTTVACIFSTFEVDCAEIKTRNHQNMNPYGSFVWIFKSVSCKCPCLSLV